MKKPHKRKDHHKTGPEPDRLKIDVQWEKAVRVAIKKKKPESGWPKAEK